MPLNKNNEPICKCFPSQWHHQGLVRGEALEVPTATGSAIRWGGRVRPGGLGVDPTCYKEARWHL